MPGLITTAEKADVQSAEENVVQEVRNRAKRQISGVNGNSDVHVRDILPDEDLESGADNGWSGDTREWLQGGLSVDTLNETYTIDSGNDMEGKVVGIMALSSFASSPITTEITFEDGTGSTFERLQFQEALTYDDGEYALLRNPIVIDEGKDAVINQYSDTDASDDNLIFHGVIAEKAGTTLGTRSGESAPAGTSRQIQRR